MEEAIKIHTWHARPFRPRYYFVSFNRNIAMRTSHTAKLCFHPGLHKFRHAFLSRSFPRIDVNNDTPFNKCRRERDGWMDLIMSFGLSRDFFFFFGLYKDFLIFCNVIGLRF